MANDQVCTGAKGEWVPHLSRVRQSVRYCSRIVCLQTDRCIPEISRADGRDGACHFLVTLLYELIIFQFQEYFMASLLLCQFGQHLAQFLILHLYREIDVPTE